MLRLSAILTLLFYLTISTGIHVDIDTCCKSIAGISLSGDASEHQNSSSGCCAEIAKACCAENSERGCELDCVFVQVLPLQQLATSRTLVTASEFEINTELAFLRAETIDLERDRPLDKKESVPWTMKENLFIQYQRLLIYG